MSRTDSNKAYATGSACGETKEQAKENAIDAITNKYPLIAEELRDYVIVKKTKGAGDFCYDAVITRLKWSLFTNDMRDVKEEIAAHSTEYVSIFEFNDKDVLINTLLTERHRFNETLKTAKMLAPMDIEPFPVDFRSLEDSVNVLPSVKIRVQPCNNNRNFQCDVRFTADIKDESKKLSYMWDFGEGSKSESRNATHRYNKVGSYSVSLQVTDVSGLSTFSVKDILVTDSRQRQKAREKNSLNAKFILKKKSYKVNENIYYDNRTYPKGSPVKEYLWEFGDGEVSTERNPQYSYSEPGIYNIKYKVCNEDNDCAYASRSIRVVEQPQQTKPVAAKKPTAKPVAKRSVKPATKPVIREKKAAIAKAPGVDAKYDEPIESYIARNGQPSKKIVKKNASMTAYLYDDVWLLAKRNKIKCAVEENALSTTLMGNPKKCHWHERNKKEHMVMLSK